MPTVVQVENVTDSWEVLASEEQGLSGTVVQSLPERCASRCLLYSRLTKLQYLTWPQIPVKTSQLLAHKYPKVAVNPKSGLCPEQADPAIAVDEPLIQSVAPFWEQEKLPVCLLEEVTYVAHICLTMYAYQSRVQRTMTSVV